jgi:hypothetical protein
MLQRNELLDAMMRVPQNAGMCMDAAVLAPVHKAMVAPARSNSKARMATALRDSSSRSLKMLREK